MSPTGNNSDIVQSIDALRNAIINERGIYPAFSASQSVATSIPSATFTKVGFQTEQFDNTSSYDSTLSRFTVPSGADGVYIFTACYQMSLADTNTCIITLYKNGVEFRRGNRMTSSGTAENDPLVSSTLYLVAGDYVECYGWQSSGVAKSTVALDHVTWFTGARVS